MLMLFMFIYISNDSIIRFLPPTSFLLWFSTNQEIKIKINNKPAWRSVSATAFPICGTESNTGEISFPYYYSSLLLLLLPYL